MKIFGTSLYQKLAVRFLVILGVLSFAQATLLWNLWIGYSNRQEQAVNWNLAKSIVPLLANALEPGSSYEELLQLRSTILQVNPRITLYIVDDQGAVLSNLSLQEPVYLPTIDMAPIQKFLTAKSASEAAPLYGDDPVLFNRKAVFSAAPLRLNGKAAYLYVVLNTFTRTSLGTRFAENSAMVLSGVALLLSCFSAGFVGLALLYFLTKRFQRLHEGVDGFRQGDYGKRVVVDGDDEIASLGATFNQMAAAIESNIERLEQRDFVRRALIADVSHDLRGPVANISAHLSKFEKESASAEVAGIRESVKNFAAVIKNATRSLQELLEQLFELARLEAKEQVLQPIGFEVVELLGSIVAGYRPKAESLGINLIPELPQEAVFVRGDVQRIERAISNLVDNAIRYTPAEGSVRVGCDIEGPNCRIFVEDTGPGFSPEDRARIGEKFFTASGAPPRSGHSTGLGLSIVTRIVELHGAALEVFTELGKGTKFSFVLPRVSE